MLDTAATAAAAIEQQGDEARADIMNEYLQLNSRLACQWLLRPADDGLEIQLPDDVTNVLEVPLSLRGSR